MQRGNWKYIGYFLFFIGMALFVYGLSVYLEGPQKKGTSSFQCDYTAYYPLSQDFSSCGGALQNKLISYLVLAPGLVVDRNIKVVISNKSKEIKNTYLITYSNISELSDISNFSQWFESKLSSPDEEIIEIRNNSKINFKVNNTKLYTLFTLNKESNITLYPSIIVTEHITFNKIDYNQAWKGFFIAIFGGAIILFGSFLGNPIDKMIIKICSVTKTLYSLDYRRYREIYWNDNFFYWKWILGILTLALIVLFSNYIFNFEKELPTEINFLVQDYFIREAVYIFLILLLLVFSYILFFEIIERILFDLFCIFRERRGININLIIAQKRSNIFFGELGSPLAISMYIITGVFFMVSTFFNLHLPISTILYSFTPLIFLFSYFIVISNKKAYGEFTANYLKEANYSKIFLAECILTGIWILLVSLLFLRFAIRTFNDTIFELTIGNSLFDLVSHSFLRDIGFLNSDILNAIPQIISKEFIYTIIILFMCLYLFVIILTNYLTLPALMRKQEMILDLKEILIFMLTFSSIQIISAYPDFINFNIKEILETSLLGSLIARFFTHSYRLFFSKDPN